MPSWKSAEASSLSWPRTSPSRASSSVEWLAADTAAFTVWWTSGGPAARVLAKSQAEDSS